MLYKIISKKRELPVTLKRDVLLKQVQHDQTKLAVYVEVKL